MFMFASKYIKCHLSLFKKLIVLLLFCSVWFSLFVIPQIFAQAFINLQAGWQLSLALPNAPLSSGCVNIPTKLNFTLCNGNKLERHIYKSRYCIYTRQLKIE